MDWWIQQPQTETMDDSGEVDAIETLCVCHTNPRHTRKETRKTWRGGK